MPLVARRPWAVGAIIVLAAPALLPLLSAAAAWAAPAGEVWAHQLQYVLPRVAGNTLLLLLIVGSATGILGTALAWLVAGYEFPGRSVFAWALLLPLAVPGYVLAVVFAGRSTMPARCRAGCARPSTRACGCHRFVRSAARRWC